MLNDTMNHFNFVKEFGQAGYFETDHHKQIVREVKTSIIQGKLIAITGIVGCGKTLIMRQIQKALRNEKKILICKSLSVDKDRVTIPVLMTAMFYDLSSEKTLKIPSHPEKRIRMLTDLIRKKKRPVALFIDEAHDLHGKTLVGLKRLMEVVQDSGNTLSIVLAGHPKLKNDLRRSSIEEIGSRAFILNLEGIIANKAEYLEWLFKNCIKSGTQIDTLISSDAIDIAAKRLVSPLQIQHYLSLAFDEAFRIGTKPVTSDIIESVIARDIDHLEPKLARSGYNVKTISGILNLRPAIIKSFLHGQLSPERTQEIHKDMVTAGIAV